MPVQKNNCINATEKFCGGMGGMEHAHETTRFFCLLDDSTTFGYADSSSNQPLHQPPKSVALVNFPIRASL
jgi:hypothetical protein